ncbi:MAG: hypothetical protein P4L76_10870 [Beijerinckiaceae bacterium]|nr:hypothetical protein [Beijerinckiaceae bacterium]
MSIGPEFCRAARWHEIFDISALGLKAEWKRLIDDLGTILLAGLCLAGLVIVASTFDGDLEGSDEIIAAILGTLSLFGILAGLELADRLKIKRRSSQLASQRGVPPLFAPPESEIPRNLVNSEDRS